MRKINKKCIKLIVLISILVVIPSVCFAVDNGNGTDINHKIVAINEQTEVYVSLDGDNNNNGTIDNPKLTLDGDKGAIAYANSLNITTILLGNGTFIFDRIEINKNVYSLDNLIIKGSGSTIISASGYNNIFNIGLKEITSKPMNITFYNIDFTNSDYYFPAISNYHSYLTIINCNFYGNKAQSSASCIGNFYNSTLEIYNSKFYDNNDENSYGVIESSSAEFSIKLNLDNNIYIENCQFFNNSAESGGVIINIADGLNVFLSVINSNFTNNSVNGEGGAIYTVAFSNENIVSSAIANISECIFENNFAKSAGGAIYTGGNAILSVSSSKFYNNYVSNKLEISNSGVGGAIFAGAGSVIIANSEFSYNSASKGGAIFNTMSSDIIIFDSSFNSNEANIGGAVYMDLPRDYGQYSAFNNLTFDSNIANIGEAIFSNDLNRDNEGLFEFFNCSNSSFKNNNVYNVGNLGLLNNNFTNSNIINTGVLITDGNDYYNSSINNIDNQLNITFLNNVSGYFGDIVKIQANVSNILPNNIIVFVIGLKEYIAIYNESSKLYEFDYKILSGNDLKGYGYSLLDNDADSNEFIIKVLKLPVDLVLQIDNIYEGDKLNISVFLSSNNTLLNANVVVVVNNKNYNVFVKNGHGNISIADDSLKIGAYNATASYGRNSFQYEYTNTTKIFYVVSNDVIIIDSLDGAIININNVSGYFLDNAVIIANISKDGKLAFYNKPLQFKIGNQIINSVFNETSKNYNANFVINQNKTSKITVYTNETPIVNEGTFTLLKYQTNINLIIQDIIFNHTALVVNINLTSEGRNINGIVNLNISNTSYIVNINEGKGKYEIFNLDIGNYTAIAKYDGSDIYNTSSASLDFKVLFNSKLTTIISKNIELYCRNGTSFEITLVDSYNKPIANKEILFYINGGISKRVTDENGKASLGIWLSPKVYTIVTEFEGDESYDSVTVNNIIDVLSTIEGKDIVKIYANDTHYYAKFLDFKGNPLSNTDIQFNINGVIYTKKTDNDGVAKLSIYLAPKNYIITAINPLNNQLYSNNITVLSSIKGNNLVKYFQNDSHYSATFYNEDGTPLVNQNIQLNINGVIYTKKTDNNGVATLGIYLKQGVYIITAINPINGQLYSNTVTVLPVLEAEDISMYFQDGTSFKVKALNGDGSSAVNANITLNINGVFYNKTTDSDGTASLTIYLKPGVYIITSYFGNEVISNTIEIFKR